MTDEPRAIRSGKPSKQSRSEMMKDWGVSADGRSFTRTFSISTPRDASRFASRAVAFAIKHEVAVDVHSEGLSLTVSMPSSGPQTNLTVLLDRKRRGLAQRLERLISRPAAPENTDEQA